MTTEQFTLKGQQTLEDTYVMHTFGRKPFMPVSGQGMVLVDERGKEYLDFIGGIGVISLGHCHPALTKAISDQAARLMHVSNYYYIEGRGELARDLSNLLNEGVESSASEAGSAEGPEPWQTFFANSGAEANECAIKLARIYAGKRAAQTGAEPARTIVTLQNSFHGRTMATLAATAQPAKQEAFKPLPQGFTATPSNDIEALEQLFEREGASICAVMLEPIQGECGVRPCTQEFLQAARRLTSEYDALLIFDEVQCGMFRCGTYPFAFQHSGVCPDIVSMAKGIGGGFPLGACAARESVAAAFQPGDHGSTFGGSNLAITAARCVLKTVREEGIAENAAQTGAYLQAELAKLDDVVEVRGKGLMVACDLRDGFDAHGVVAKMLEAGVLINATGPHTLRFLPPLVCEPQHVDEMLKRLAAVFEAQAAVL